MLCHQWLCALPLRFSASGGGCGRWPAAACTPPLPHVTLTLGAVQSMLHGGPLHAPTPCAGHQMQDSASNTVSVHGGCKQHHFQPGWPNYRHTSTQPEGGRGQMNTSGFDRLLLYKRTTGSDGWISLPTFVWFQLIQVLPSIRL